MSDPENLDDLPASVREIAEVIGRAPTLRMLGQLPEITAGIEGKRGRRPLLYVPKRITPDHRLYRILGPEGAEKLARAFGGESLQPANCRGVYIAMRDAALLQMLATGARATVVSEITGVSIRQIRNIRRKRGAAASGAAPHVDNAAGGAYNPRPTKNRGNGGRDH